MPEGGGVISNYYLRKDLGKFILFGGILSVISWTWVGWMQERLRAKKKKNDTFSSKTLTP